MGRRNRVFVQHLSQSVLVRDGPPLIRFAILDSGDGLKSFQECCPALIDNCQLSARDDWFSL